jgi:hypothetical protein
MMNVIECFFRPGNGNDAASGGVGGGGRWSILPPSADSINNGVAETAATRRGEVRLALQK